jgi:hypothetical protein
MMILANKRQSAINFTFNFLFFIIDLNKNYSWMKTISLYILFILLPVVASLTILLSCDFILQQQTEPEYVLINYPQPLEIKIITPAFADEFTKGENILIKWNSNVQFKAVDLALFKKNALIRVISDDLININEYNWKIPDDIGNSVQYSIRVSDAERPEVFTISDRFSIVDN